VHYVPLGLNESDWFETVRFFAREETGQYLGERMAAESRQWAKSALRREDMEVWTFRLLLEYVFSISPLITGMLELSTIIATLSDFTLNLQHIPAAEQAADPKPSNLFNSPLFPSKPLLRTFFTGLTSLLVNYVYLVASTPG